MSSESLRVPIEKSYGRVAILLNKAESSKGLKIPRTIKKLVPEIESAIAMILDTNNLIPIEVISAKSIKVVYEDEYYYDVGHKISIHLKCLFAKDKEVVLKLYFSTLRDFVGDTPKGIVLKTRKSHGHFPQFFKTGATDHEKFLIYYQIYEYIYGDMAPNSLKGMSIDQKFIALDNIIETIKEGYFDLDYVLWDLRLDQFFIRKKDGKWIYIDIEEFPHSDQLCIHMADMLEKLERIVRYLPREQFRLFKDTVRDLSDRTGDTRPIDYSREQADKDIGSLMDVWSEIKKNYAFSGSIENNIPGRKSKIGL